ncbi:MAG: BrnT family toxin [Pseudomonas sp.]|uniref:BrnT family toxin n=1 Tax=Pseudomonas sp. TaxID=306 RepID=UPI002734D366|nr:BrnT family toxin [Pseudomonas sp.]MDP3846307.1 BrnT family toxin [Pseudomonas sp.]
MNIEFDAAKNDRNLRERDLSFTCAASFDFETAVFAIGDRKDYGEVRIRALGWLDERLHALVFVEVADGIRVISFRKANSREVRGYVAQTQS